MNRKVVSGFIYILIGCVVIFFVINQFSSKENDDFIPVSNLQEDVSSINTINIEAAVTGIIISKSKDGNLHAVLEQSGNGDSLTLITPKSSSDTLNIEVKSKNTFPNFLKTSVLSSKLQINIPDSYSGQLNIETDTGSIQINDLELNKVEAESKTGSIKINNIIANELSLSTKTGSINVHGSEVERFEAESKTGSIHTESTLVKFNIETTTGSIHFKQDDIYGDSEISSTTGSVHVNLNENPNSLRLSFKTDVGSSRINVDDYNVIQNSKKDKELQFGDGEHHLKVETTTGSFHLN